MVLIHLSDTELLAKIQSLCATAQQLLARVIGYLVEVEQRQIHLKEACASLFDFCVRRLNMSESAAFRRVAAARLVKRFPSVLDRIERGEVHLSGLLLLRDHLSEANHEELLAAAAGKTRRQLQELLAARFPRPDVPSRIRKLPKKVSTVTPADEQPSPAKANTEIEPLSPARYRVQLTVGVELRDKLARATEMMRHQNPSGDLAAILDTALDLLLAKLEKQKFGKTTRPRAKTQAAVGYVTRAARREVFERDGEQCSFVGTNGQRCPSRAFVEVDHIHPRARGGSGEHTNLRVLCKAHNALCAEQAFGKEHIAQRVESRRRTAAAATPAKPATETEKTTTTGSVDPDDAHENLGFRENETRPALVSKHQPLSTPHLELRPSQNGEVLD